MLSPVENLPVTVFPSSAISEFNKQVEEMDRDRERIVVTHQVKYRVTIKQSRVRNLGSRASHSRCQMSSNYNSLLFSPLTAIHKSSL